MSIKADWNLADLALDEDDPFDMVILSSGLTIDLSGDVAEIERGIRDTLEREAALFDRGTTCGLKDDGQDCLTCARFNYDDRLCRLGRDQRVLEVRHAVLVAKRDGAYRALAATFDVDVALAHHAL